MFCNSQGANVNVGVASEEDTKKGHGLDARLTAAVIIPRP